MIESPLRIVSSLPRQVRILLLGTLINKIGSFIVPYLAIVLRREFSLSGAEVGWLIGAYGLGSIFSILSGGALADRLGRRTTLLLSLTGSGALAVAMGLVSTLAALLPLLVAFGFLADLYRPAASAVIGDVLPSSQRAAGFAGLRTAVNLGFAVGMAAGGVLAEWSWRALFIADGVTTLAYGAVVLLFIEETRPHAPMARGLPTGGASPWRDRVFMELIVVSFGFALTFSSFITVLPLTITVTAGYPAWVFGLLTGTNGLIIASFEVSVAHAMRHRRRLLVSAVGTGLAAVGFALTGLVLHWSWFLLTVMIWTTGEILASPAKLSFIADWAPPASRGRYLSLAQATWGLGFALNPVLFLPLYDRLPVAVFWLVFLPVGVAGVLILWRLDRFDRHELLRGLQDG